DRSRPAATRAGAGEVAAAAVDGADVRDPRRRQPAEVRLDRRAAGRLRRRRWPRELIYLVPPVFEFAATIGHSRVDVEDLVGPVDGREHRLEGVVILLRDRIELVVVALGTVNSQAEKGADRVGDEIVAVEMAGDLAVDLGFGQLGVADEVPRARGE